MARLRGGPSGKVTAISDSAVGAANAPPTPCAARAASSQAWLVANPPSREASENSTMPAMKTRRRPEQVAGPAAEQQQAAEGQGIGIDDPLKVAAGEAERALDVRQGHVDDGRVEHDHELCRRDDGEGQAQPSRRACCRGGGRLRGTDLCGGHDNLPGSELGEIAVTGPGHAPNVG